MRDLERARATRRRYREAHREERRAAGRLYRERHRDEIATKREAHREELRAYARQYGQAHRARFADLKLQAKYGISQADYDRQLAEQGGVCAICRRPEHRVRAGQLLALAVDHDHGSARVRGLLCADCNRGVGIFGDDPARLKAAADYLARAEAEAGPVVPAESAE